MLKAVDSLCKDFNHFVGKMSYHFLNEEDYKTKTKVGGFVPLLKAGFVPLIKAGCETVSNAAKYEMDKSLVAYNIKAAIYNIATVAAIGSIAALILGNPVALIPLGACIAAGLFVDRAMEKTVMGSVGNECQKNDNSIGLFFKPFFAIKA